jgi:type IV pilus assembly protein PilA
MKGRATTRTGKARGSAGRAQRGFSLIELLIVVGIILVIAALALVSLMQAKIAANEAAAVNSIKTLNTGNVTYAADCPSVGYAASLADLGPGAGGCVGGANITDPILGVAAPTRSGYGFTYAAIAVGGLNTSYSLNGDPLNQGVSGTRHFYSDQTGVIHYAESAAATAASSVLQ